jgi:hypothetical protein
MDPETVCLRVCLSVVRIVLGRRIREGSCRKCGRNNDHGRPMERCTSYHFSHIESRGTPRGILDGAVLILSRALLAF